VTAYLAPAALLAWGLWCLLLAPALAARYGRADPKYAVRPDLPELDYPLANPLQWRVMGAVWCLLSFGWMAELW
jgi:hypothetical protein